MENKEKPKTKFAQVFASISSFSIGRKTFVDLLMVAEFLPLLTNLFREKKKDVIQSFSPYHHLIS